MVKILNVSKMFKQTNKENLHALNNIYMQIDEASIFGVIGLSGAGKSTLLRSIVYLEKIDSGSIFINGIDISKLNNKDLRLFRRNIGVVFQGYNLLYQKNVQRNIALPLEINGCDNDYINQRVKHLIEVVGLSGKENAYPSQLSGGQKQRVAIARALALKPKLLLLDEITSALDSITTKQILKLLLDIRDKTGVSIILITHEISVISLICDKVAVLNNGKIVETGDVSDILQSPKSIVTKMLLGWEDLDDWLYYWIVFKDWYG